MSKCLIATALLCLSINIGYSQTHASKAIIVAEVPERVKLLRASLTIEPVDESIFWNIFNEYNSKKEQLQHEGMYAFFELIDASDGRGNPSKQASFYFKKQLEDIYLKRTYFNRINISTNGLLAFDFLQNEMLYDLLYKSVYMDKYEWNKPSFELTVETTDTAKYLYFRNAFQNIIDEKRFWKLFDEFQFSYVRVIGEQMVWFEHYIEDASDLTPGHCRQLGQEFLDMLERELLVKEKYYRQFERLFNPQEAARFFALEDYYSTHVKLKVWNDVVIHSTP